LFPTLPYLALTIEWTTVKVVLSLLVLTSTQ
jgi:hypothetical protein